MEMDIDFQDNQGPVSSMMSSSDQIFQIMQEFPLLSSWKANTYWTGFIKGQRNLVRIAISVPNFPFRTGSSLQGDADSVKIFEDFGETFASTKDGLLVDLLQEVMSCVRQYEEKHASNEDDPGNPNLTIGLSNPEFFLAIFNELDAIGVENVETVSKDFQNLSMKYIDQLQRKHIIKCVIPQKYPRAGLKVFVDLPPASAGIEWPTTTLSDVFDRFKAEVDKYVVFWSVMDELDNQARLIDPIQPKRGDIHRRILMNQNVVVNLLFNPLCPKALPEIKFSGPEKNVLELDALVDSHCKEWSEDKSILENLEDIVQCEFLLANNEEDNQSGASQDLQSLCVICYSFEFEGTVPETTCECGSIYHDKCLRDLLVNDCSVKAKRFCVDCPVCGLELKVSKALKVTW